MDHKTSQLLEEIDLARCRAQWSVAHDLAKKYKKIKPDDSVLEVTVCAEADLIQLLKTSADVEKRGWDIIHQNDTPQQIALLPSIDPKKVQHSLKRLHSLRLEEEDNAESNNWQKQFSKIILARVYFESGQYEKALQALQKLALRIDDVQSGYGLVLLVQARAIKGICLEKQGNDEAAVEAYQAAWDAVELQPQERGIMLSFWIEECLYRACLLRLKLNHPVTETISMMRAYVQLVSSHWSPHWRMFRRWVIFKYYADYLVKTYQNGLYVTTLTKSTNSISNESAAFEELSTLMALFRHLFTIIGPQISSRSKSVYGMTLSRITMKSHDTIGWGELGHIRRVLQFLYQVKSATFNNPTISRYIFFTLMRLGSLEEAKNALRAYLDLMGVPDFATDVILDDTPKTDTEASAGSHDLNEKDHATDTSRPLATRTKAARILARLSESQGESLESIVQVILAGIYLYGHEEQDGQLSAILSDLGMDLLIESKATTHWADMYRARGTSYCLLASQCEDPEDRAAHHETAINALQLAVHHQPDDWKTHYILGLQQALMRDTHAAILSVNKSVELNSDHVPSWHLLALLYSCRRTDKLSNALITLEVGLNKSSAQYREGATLGAIPVYSWTNGELNANDLFDHAESYLSMRMSQLALVEAMEGPESTISQYEELFTIYAQLTQQLGLAGSLTIPTVSPEDLMSSHISEQSSPVRRKSSISLIRRTSKGSITSTKSGRPRSSSVESTSQTTAPTISRRAESDTDDYSDDSTTTSVSRQSSLSRRQSKKRQQSLAKTLKQQQYQQQQEAAAAAELKKKNLQLIDLGLARRIGTAVASQSIHQGSNRSLVGSEATTPLSGAVSLASYFTPAYSKGNLRSNSVSSRTSSVIMSSKVVTKDGLMVSTFNQHHQAFELRKKTQWHSLLVTLWLMSTKTFIKAGLLEEASKALSEAEQLGLGDPNVWYQLGQFSLEVRRLLTQKKTPTLQDKKTIKEMKQVATDAYEKALVLDPEHVASQVAKARLLAESEMVLAEGLLEQVTHGLGWDSSEAWVEYAYIKKQQGELSRVKNYLLYALELNDTEPIRSLSILPKFILY